VDPEIYYFHDANLLNGSRPWIEEVDVSVLPAVVKAEYRGDFNIWLSFNDGVQRTVDFSDWLEGPVFEPLKDLAYFTPLLRRGGTVTWPNGADIAPETLHERAKASAAA
jgi:hypothetical protein